MNLFNANSRFNRQNATLVEIPVKIKLHFLRLFPFPVSATKFIDYVKPGHR